MEIKATYTDEEINDLVGWFDSRMEQIPSELRLEKAIFIPDLHRTVRDLSMLARERHTNPTFGAQIGLLIRIQEKLSEEMGGE